MIIAVILGVPLAWMLARPGLRAASLLRALITIPLVLPPVVGGVALSPCWAVPDCWVGRYTNSPALHFRSPRTP